MGICYSQQQQWEAYHQNRPKKNKKGKKDKSNPIIYEQKSTYTSSFASNVYDSFRDDLHITISELALEEGSVFMGSIVQLKQQQIQILYKSLHKINLSGKQHELTQPIILCNLKTKNYLHTHKIKIPQCKLLNQISCCPFNSNHIVEYDIWKFIRVQAENKNQIQKQQDSSDCSVSFNTKINVYIYHPFTQRFLAYQKNNIVGSQNKYVWNVQSFGKRRNGGFIKISCEQGQLCMSEHKGLLQKHRKLQLCKQKHVSHLWEIMFVDLQAA